MSVYFSGTSASRMVSSFGPSAGNLGKLEMAFLVEATAQFDTSSGCATFSPVEAEKGIAVLRHEAAHINHLVINRVAEAIEEMIEKDLSFTLLIAAGGGCVHATNS